MASSAKSIGNLSSTTCLQLLPPLPKELQDQIAEGKYPDLSRLANCLPNTTSANTFPDWRKNELYSLKSIALLKTAPRSNSLYEEYPAIGSIDVARNYKGIFKSNRALLDIISKVQQIRNEQLEKIQNKRIRMYVNPDIHTIMNGMDRIIAEAKIDAKMSAQFTAGLRSTSAAQKSRKGKKKRIHVDSGICNQKLPPAPTLLPELSQPPQDLSQRASMLGQIKVRAVEMSDLMAQGFSPSYIHQQINKDPSQWQVEFETILNCCSPNWKANGMGVWTDSEEISLAIMIIEEPRVVGAIARFTAAYPSKTEAQVYLKLMEQVYTAGAEQAVTQHSS